MNALRWSAFALSALAAVALGFLAFDSAQSGQFFSRLGYWNILLCFAWFAALVAKTYRKEITAWISRKENWILVGVALIATAFLYTREGGGFKITFDEHAISNVSKSLHLERVAEIRSSSIPGIRETATIDKRPLLFHFLLTSIHDLSGYRVSNAFVLNAILTFLFLLALHTSVSKIYNRRSGWFALLLACCSPLIAQNASGGGMETINVLGFMSCFLFALKYAEKPDSIGRLSCFIIAVCLFSHARYESPLLIAPTVAVIAINWFRIRNVQMSWTLAAAPLFFIPIAWQHRYADSIEGLKQYAYDSSGLFSLDYVSNNLGHAINFLFSTSETIATSVPLSVFGVTSIIALATLSVARFGAWNRKFKQLYVAQIFGIAIGLQLFLILGFTFGQLDNPSVSRLGLPFTTLMIVCSALCFSLLQAKAPKAKLAGPAAIALCFIYALPIYAKHSYTSENPILKRIERIDAFHSSLPKGNYLYISLMPQDFEVKGIANTNIKWAIYRVHSFAQHAQAETYDGIFAIQTYKVAMTNGRIEETLLPGNDLGPWFELETVLEFSSTPFNLTRISRVTNVFSDKDDSEERKALRKELLSQSPQRTYTIDPKSHEIWKGSLP